jgi:hypothetical protein
MCWFYNPELTHEQYQEVMMQSFYLLDEKKYGDLDTQEKQDDFKQRSERYAIENWHHLATMLNMIVNNNEFMVKGMARCVYSVPPKIGCRVVIADMHLIYTHYPDYINLVAIGDAGFVKSIGKEIEITFDNVSMFINADDYALIFCTFEGL